MDHLLHLAKRLARPLKRLLVPARRDDSAPRFTPGPETIIFVHVPKAAGTTLNLILRKLYGSAMHQISTGLQDDREITELRLLPEDARRRVKLLSGHFAFGLHVHLPQPCTYITLLRDPVERILSSYYYIQREPKHFRHTQVVGGGLSLEEYVDLEKLYLNNGQTQIFAGPGRDDSPEELLARAQENLDRYFAVVGLSERFDESLSRMEQCFGWPHLPFQSQNITHDRPRKIQIPDRVIEKIRDLNTLDLALYDWAAERFTRGKHLADRGVKLSIS